MPSQRAEQRLEGMMRAVQYASRPDDLDAGRLSFV